MCVQHRCIRSWSGSRAACSSNVAQYYNSARLVRLFGTASTRLVQGLPYCHCEWTWDAWKEFGGHCCSWDKAVGAELAQVGDGQEQG